MRQTLCEEYLLDRAIVLSSGELVAVAFIEQCGQLVESVYRDLFDCGGGHGVLL